MNEDREFLYGWHIVMAAAIGVGLCLSPIPFYEIGVFAPELVREFKWGIGDVMGGVVFMMIGVLIASTIVDLLADGYGVRLVTTMLHPIQYPVPWGYI